MSRTLYRRFTGERLGSPFRDRGPRARGARDVEIEVHSRRSDHRSALASGNLTRPTRLY